MDLSYNSVLTLSNKISYGLNDNAIVKMKKGRKVKDESAMKSRLAVIVNDDSALTLKGVSETLQLYGLHGSQPTISRTLKKINITWERLTNIPVEMNSEKVIGLKYSYAMDMRNHSPAQLVYLDETGFHLHMQTNYGYSQKNTKAIAMIPANKGINVSLMAAIDINGIIAYEFIDGAYNGNTFISFIREKLAPYFASH